MFLLFKPLRSFKTRGILSRRTVVSPFKGEYNLSLKHEWRRIERKKEREREGK